MQKVNLFIPINNLTFVKKSYMESLFERHAEYLTDVPTSFERELMRIIDWESRLILIRGPKGVGKSTLAEYMQDKMKDALIFDAEAVGNAVRDNYPDHPYGFIFEDYELWGDFSYKLIKDIHENFHKDVIVPMTLLRQNSYRIIEKLRKDGIDTHLVVLEADHQTVHDRILDRGEKEGCWCMENIDLSREGTAALPGIHVATDDKSVVELYEWICNKIGILDEQRIQDSK